MNRLSALLIVICLASCADNGGDSAAKPDSDTNSTQPSVAKINNKSKGDNGQVILTATDDVKIFGTLSKADEDNDRVILLFHQARSNRHEYDSIAPRLNELGFDTLAIDQRSGGSMWDHDNETVKANGESTEYLYALPDLQAAVDWAIMKEYTSIITVGSSYTAALNFVLAKENGEKLTAIASFSPGEYLGTDDLVKNAAAEVKIPIYVTADASHSEQDNIDDVLSKAESDKITRYKPEHGVHGASTLIGDKNPEGAEENFTEFSKFLNSLGE